MKVKSGTALVLGLCLTFVAAAALAALPLYAQMHQNKDSAFCLFDRDGMEIRSDNAWGCAIDIEVVAGRYFLSLLVTLAICLVVFAIAAVVIVLMLDSSKKSDGKG